MRVFSLLGTIFLFFVLSCSSMVKLNKIKGKEIVYEAENSSVILSIYIDSSIQIADTSQYYQLFGDILAFPVGRFKLVAMIGCFIGDITEGTVWYNPRGYLFLKSDRNCSDQVYYAMRECVDCPDSVHRIRIFVADCLNIPVQDHITEKVLVNACDSVYSMNITFSAGCEEKIQYIPQSCDSLKISIVSAGKTQLESETIYLNQGFGDQKDVIISLKLDNIMSIWWFYTVNGSIPLNKKRFTFCIYDCKDKEVKCYRFRRYKR